MLDSGKSAGKIRAVIPAARIFVLCALMISIGAQWAVLQGVAWIGMAVTYSLEAGSVSEGIGKTFDGDHPCPLCETVKKATQEKDDPEAPVPNDASKLKVEICESVNLRLFAPPNSRLPAGHADLPGASRAFAPTGQPPELRA